MPSVWGGMWLCAHAPSFSLLGASLHLGLQKCVSLAGRTSTLGFTSGRKTRRVSHMLCLPVQLPGAPAVPRRARAAGGGAGALIAAAGVPVAGAALEEAV